MMAVQTGLAKGHRTPEHTPRGQHKDPLSCHVTQFYFCLHYVMTDVKNNKNIIKITVHDEINIYFSFREK